MARIVMDDEELRQLVADNPRTTVPERTQGLCVIETVSGHLSWIGKLEKLDKLKKLDK